MSTISEKQLDDYLNSNKIEEHTQFYLIYGEKLLVNKSLHKIINAILPNHQNIFSIEIFDDNISKAINTVNTFSLSKSEKIVILRNFEFFLNKNQNAKTKNKVNIDRNLTNSSRKKISDSCLTLYSEKLETLIEKGLPEKHYMILLSNDAEKKTSLFKTINKKGMIIDCSIVNKVFEETLFRETMNKILNKNKKNIEEEAYKTIRGITNSDLSVFSNNIDKLIDYIGKRKHITTKDVKTLIERTKKDQLFDFTNALSEQNLANSLFYLNSLLYDNIHPLKVLSAITNMTRKLILAKIFILSDKNTTWKTGETFNYFKSTTMNSLKEYDSYVENILFEWNKSGNLVQENTTRKNKFTSFLLKNSNPYFVYKTIEKADKLDYKLLLSSIRLISNADIKLKSNRYRSKSILQSVIFFICGYLSDKKYETFISD